MSASISFSESFAYRRHNGRMAQKPSIDRARGERIKHVRKKLLSLTQEKFAEVLTEFTGATLTRGAVGNWELGKDVGIDNLKAIARLVGISLDWLAYAEGEEPSKVGEIPSDVAPTSTETVPLVGFVRAGAQAYFYGTISDPLDWVNRPKDATDETVAVQIQGESLGTLFDQWLVYYDEVRSPITPDLVGRLCVCGLLDDRVVVKKITRGSKPERYDLISNTGEEPMRDTEVVWAARVKQMTPR